MMKAAQLDKLHFWSKISKYYDLIVLGDDYQDTINLSAHSRAVMYRRKKTE